VYPFDTADYDFKWKILVMKSGWLLSSKHLNRGRASLTTPYLKALSTKPKFGLGIIALFC